MNASWVALRRFWLTGTASPVCRTTWSASNVSMDAMFTEKLFVAADKAARQAVGHGVEGGIGGDDPVGRVDVQFSAIALDEVDLEGRHGLNLSVAAHDKGAVSRRPQVLARLLRGIVQIPSSLNGCTRK